MLENLKIKNIAIAITILAVIGVLVYLKYSGSTSIANGNNASYSTSSSSSNDTTSSTPTLTVKPTSGQSLAVNVQSPPQPVGGKRRGIIQLAPSGLYVYIVDTDGQNYKLVSRELKKALLFEGFGDEQQIKDGVTQFVQKIFDAGATRGNVQFIVSSSGADNENIRKMSANLAKGGYIVNKTTTQQEGALALKVSVAPQYRANSFLVDVTPSLIRVSWYQNGQPMTIATKYGFKYSVDGVTDDAAISEINRVVAQVPQQNRQHGYVIWASVNDALKQVASGQRYVSLQSSFESSDKTFQNGIGLLNAVGSTTNAEMFFDTEASYAMAY